MREHQHVEWKESWRDECLKWICGFANARDGTLALGVEDAKKAQGQDRLFGLSENPEAVDELRRKVPSCLLPAVDGIRWVHVTCRLRDGEDGHITLVIVPQSPKVHSILGDGTWVVLQIVVDHHAAIGKVLL